MSDRTSDSAAYPPDAPERFLGTGVAGDVRVAVVLLHREAQLLDAHDRLVEAAARQDVRQRSDAIEDAGDARVLREVAQAALAMDDARRRRRRASEHAQQAGLARTVAADETDLVAGADGERGAFEHEAPTDLHRELAGLQHEDPGYGCEARSPVPFPQ